MKEYFKSNRTWALLLLLGCAFFAFMPMFRHVNVVFNDELEDMSHGWLVVPFSLYVLWTQRDKIKASLSSPSILGFLASIPFILIALLGTRGIQIRFEQLGFIGLCVTIPWMFYGRSLAKHFLFPALFLLFTIPLNTFLDVITIHLRLLASGVALFVLKGFGLEVIRQGTAVISQGAHPFSIDVAAPCSGMRSIFALMALTAAYAWFTQPTWLRRGLLFSCSVPLAVLGNVTRILTICLVAVGTNQQFALGFYHDYSGYIVFIVAIILMVATGGLIDQLFCKLNSKSCIRPIRSQNNEPAVAQTDTHTNSDANANSWMPWLFTIILSAVFIFQGLTPNPTVTEPPKFTLPETMEGYRVEKMRYCQNEQCGASFTLSKLEKGKEAVCPLCGGILEGCSLGELTVLPSDTRIIKRQYSSPYAKFLVSAVIGGTTKSSIHRPELCMPAQGFQMVSPQDIALPDRTFRSIKLESKKAPSVVHSYTFFNQAGVRTSSHVYRIMTDVWDRSVLNRIDRWVMITVSASAEGGFSLDDKGNRSALEAFLKNLSKELP